MQTALFAVAAVLGARVAVIAGLELAGGAGAVFTAIVLGALGAVGVTGQAIGGLFVAAAVLAAGRPGRIAGIDRTGVGILAGEVIDLAVAIVVLAIADLGARCWRGALAQALFGACPGAATAGLGAVGALDLGETSALQAERDRPRAARADAEGSIAAGRRQADALLGARFLGGLYALAAIALGAAAVRSTRRAAEVARIALVEAATGLDAGVLAVLRGRTGVTEACEPGYASADDVATDADLGADKAFYAAIDAGRRAALARRRLEAQHRIALGVFLARTADAARARGRAGRVGAGAIAAGHRAIATARERDAEAVIDHVDRGATIAVLLTRASRHCEDDGGEGQYDSIATRHGSRLPVAKEYGHSVASCRRRQQVEDATRRST